MTQQFGPLDSTRLLLVGTTFWVRPCAEALEARSDVSVRTVATAEAALDALHDGPIDGIVAEHDLDDSTGVELLRTVRSETAAVPIVLATASGDESVASEAIAAGVDDYVALQDPSDGGEADTLPNRTERVILERTERAIRSARRAGTRRDRARQFDAIFRDARTATWVLDADGRTTRVNRTARAMAPSNVESTSNVDTLVGEPFWSISPWNRSDGIRRDVRRVVETALEGRFGNAVVTCPADGDPDGDGTPRVIELSARPVENALGERTSIVVEGTDISDRVELERDLRRSEALHRVTLNNMTDTVLITDEQGEYTYVCPNVHFIFGYTAEEIRELGPIEELLGEGLFDRERLAEEGVLKNIECTATDDSGREHTLLVNVREVSIRDGTLLYSCRDITKRKQREDALATLQETAREFLYAETHREIARHVVDDTPSVLGVDAGAVYLFDPDENHLEPVARSASMEDANGPLPTVGADGEDLPGYSFVEGRSFFFDDVHDVDDAHEVPDDAGLETGGTGLRSAAYIPLGNHGVFVAGSAEIDRFDEVTRELADLLAATAEAALDRVSRESRLREQDRELQRRNRRLTALNRINETIREIDQALVRAETREEIDHTVCELLTSDDRFRFAWVGEVDSRSETVIPRARAGDERGYLDGRTFEVGVAGVEPTGRSAATGEPSIVENVPGRLREESWRTDAISRDFLSVISVPLAYNDVVYGILSVYADSRNAFDTMAREVLAELGETIGSAMGAIERKNALLTTTMTRVEFSIDDPTFVLSRLAQEADCHLSYEGGARRTAHGSYIFVTVEDVPVEAVEAAAAGIVGIDSARHVSGDGTGGVIRLRLSRTFLAQELADHGVVFRSASATPTGTTLVVDVPESVDVRRVTRLIREAFPGADLRSKRTRDRSAEEDLYSTVIDDLTDRQLEVLQTAYYSGFFESPRESTGEDVAAMLDISSTAFYRHSRTVQRKLFAALLDE